MCAVVGHTANRFLYSTTDADHLSPGLRVRAGGGLYLRLGVQSRRARRWALAQALRRDVDVVESAFGRARVEA